MNSDKKEKIIILGHSGSGKDYLRKELIKLGLKYSPKFTTRPKRLNEVNGEDYDFIDHDLYIDFHNKNLIKTSECFVISGVNWYYGITKKNWEENQIFIMTTEELRQLSKEDKNNCFIVFLKIDKDIRLQRLLERQDYNDSIQRRIEADEKDFEGFKDYDLCLTDYEFEPQIVYDLMY
jgi:guanylate kinase